MLMQRGLIALLGPFAVGSLPALPAWSAGYFIDQQSVPGLGRANAGNVAAANDPSTIFFNPAGMTELWMLDPTGTTKASTGVSIIFVHAEIKNQRSTESSPGTLGVSVPLSGTNESNPTDNTPVSSAYVAQRVNDRLFFGLGFNAPFGLSAEYDEDWFGRYDAIEVKLLTMNVNPSVAYKLSDRISIGAGFDLQYGYAELVTAIPNPLAPGGPTAATDGRFSVDGKSWAIGYNVGILYKATQSFRLGAHYRSGMDHDLSGTAVFNPGGIVTGASSEIKLPAIASAGAVWDLGPSWSLYGDATWYDWSVSKITRIKFAGPNLPDAVRPVLFRDSYTGAIGLENHWSDTLTFRAGVMVDQSPTNDLTRDTTFADDDRLWLAIGATYRISDCVIADFAYAHILIEDTTIDITRTFFGGTPLQATTSIKADVESSVDTVAFNLRYKF
jgi:long-chain fatty acid transport protein